MAASTRIPSLCRHKATGLAVVRLDGRDIYCGKFGSASARAEYDRLVTEWLRRGRAVPARVAGGPARQTSSACLSVAELILAYKRHTDEYHEHSPAEREKIRLALRPLRELYGLTPASEFGPLALKAVRDRLLQLRTRRAAIRDERGKKIGEEVVEYRLSRRTVDQRINIVKRLFAWGVENELVTAAVWHGLLAVKGLRKGKSLAKEPREVKAVADADIEAVLPLVSGPVRAMIQVQRLTGARSGEVCIMRPCDIEQLGDVWVYRPTRHKNGHREHSRREILIGPKAQAVLAPFLSRGREAFLFSPRDARAERYQLLRAGRKTKVPPSQSCRRKARPKRSPGQAYTPKSYYRAVVAACRKAGVPPWHPHQLRHAAATALRREFGVETARIILGHATAFTTEIYAEADRTKASTAAARVG